MTDGVERARLRALIARRLSVTRPPLTPELKCYGAADYLAIWTATEAELATEGLAPPFWAFAWPGGQALARRLLDAPEIAAGKRALALGAGAGLAAIAAAKAGAASATANDVDPAALAAAEMNAELNGVAVALDGRDLLAPARAALWTRAPGAEAPAVGDLILVGDLFYEQDLAARVWARLCAAADGGATVLIGDPSRGRLPEDALVREVCYDVPTPRALEDVESRKTWIWRPR